MSDITLLTAATAVNGAPSGATAGVALPHQTDLATLFVHNTAGSATMTVTLRLWGYKTSTAKWYPLGTGTAALKGVLNAGAAIAEDATLGADTLLHCEVVTSLHKINRVYLEVAAIGGTSTAVTAVLACVPCSAVTQ